MLGGADNPNGELLSYIIGADNADDFLDCFIIPARIVGGTFQG